MKTAVIYARYSSDSQTEQSIEGQLRACQQFAKNNEMLVVGTYIDRAMTGTNDARPDFQRMIKDSSKKQWESVIVYKLDRFSRNKYETTIHKHTLKENGVKVISAMENIPDTPEGIILESMLEGMNQYYSVELSQKVRRGLNESYIKGQYTGGGLIYGYDIDNKKCIINKEESEIVKEIFDKFSKGFTGVDIAKSLQERGIRTKKGVIINAKKIYKIIANTKYNGKVKFGETVYTNIYPQIINDKTWQKVQSIRNVNKHSPGRKKDSANYILSGKLVCGYCKHNMVGESGKERERVIKYRYYSCLTTRRKKGICELNSKRKELLENQIINITWKILSKDKNLQLIAKEVYKFHEKNNKNNLLLKSLEARRNDLLKKSNNLIDAIEQGIVTEQTKIRLKELESQISHLDFDIEQNKQRSYTYLTEEQIMKFLKSVICGDIENIEIQKHIVKHFIREILLYNNKVIIVYNFTEPLISKNKIPDTIEDIEILNKDFENSKSNSNYFYATEYFGINKKI